MRRETAAAIGVAREALALVQDFAGAKEATAKEGRDFATAADVNVEELIRRRLAEALGHPVVGEEQGGDPPIDGSPYWLVDPICGTANFAAGTPLYCVNLALIEGNDVVAAVVGDPSRREVVYAERGAGTWATDGGSVMRLRTDARSGLVVVEEGKSHGPVRAHGARFMASLVTADRWDFRSLGTTLSLPYLAAGRIAAYAVFYVDSLHVAAGSLLVSEAGGVLSDIEGRPWTLRSTSLLFTATHGLHAELQGIANQTRAND